VFGLSDAHDLYRKKEEDRAKEKSESISFAIWFDTLDPDSLISVAA